MKKFLLFFLLIFPTFLFGQEMMIRWEDNQGREFRVTAPSGNFSYVAVAGDKISYDIRGRVTNVGNVRISYDIHGRVSSIGNVRISYDPHGRVSSVGNLRVYYDFNGRISHTSGTVIVGQEMTTRRSRPVNQEEVIRWEDNQGRRFRITVPSGNFSYVAVRGDRIGYDFQGRVTSIGNVWVSYDHNGRVTRVGNVRISYDIHGRVTRVGNLRIHYDFNGRISRITGSVN